MVEAGTQEPKKRIPLFDLLRGVGILLVVFGHVTHDIPIRHFIYGFHMPLFFFISGALFRDRDLERFGTFARKKAQSLLVPYFCFGFLTLLWYIAVEVHIRPIEASTAQILLGLLYGAYTKWIWFNGALWFLPCLFTAECLLWLVLKTARGSAVACWVLAFFGYVIGEAAVFFSPFPLPFGLEKACRFLVFLVFGHAVRGLLVQTFPKRVRMLSGIGLSVTATAMLLPLPRSWFGQPLGISIFYDFVTYIPVAVLGIALCVGLCRTISRFQPIEFLGRHSLVFFAFQEQTYRLWLGVASKTLRIPVESMRTDLSGSLAITVATFFSIWPLVLIWNWHAGPVDKRC